MKKLILLCIIAINSHTTTPEPIDFKGMGQAIITRYTHIDWSIRATALALTACYGTYCFYSAYERNRFAGWMSQDTNDKAKQSKAYIAREDAGAYRYRAWVYCVLPFLTLLMFEYFSGSSNVAKKAADSKAGSMLSSINKKIKQFGVYTEQPDTVAEVDRIYKDAPMSVRMRKRNIARWREEARKKSN